MKKAILILAAAATMLMGQTTGPIDGRVTFEWEYPIEEIAGMTFIIHVSDNMVTPMTNWAVLTNVFSQTTARATITPGKYFFFCVASNMWGVSSPSDVASTPHVPRRVEPFRVRKGH